MYPEGLKGHLLSYENVNGSSLGPAAQGLLGFRVLGLGLLGLLQSYHKSYSLNP